MKKSLQYPFTEISKQAVASLTKIEQETLATGKKTFGTVDLWNIQRQRRDREQKRIPAQVSLY